MFSWLPPKVVEADSEPQSLRPHNRRELVSFQCSWKVVLGATANGTGEAGVLRRIGVLVALLALTACEPWTKTSMLDDRTAAISGLGGTINTQSEVTKAVLQEAAKQALSRGYEYFQVMGATSGTNYAGAMVSASPTTYTQTGPRTVTATPGPVMVTPYTMPTGDITVRFFKEPPDGPGVWNARSVLATK